MAVVLNSLVKKTNNQHFLWMIVALEEMLGARQRVAETGVIEVFGIQGIEELGQVKQNLQLSNFYRQLNKHK
jgi:hypothetical protein